MLIFKTIVQKREYTISLRDSVNRVQVQASRYYLRVYQYALLISNS